MPRTKTKPIQEVKKPEIKVDRSGLRLFEPIDSMMADKIANSKATEPCYIDLYKSMHKLEWVFEGIKKIAERVTALERDKKKKDTHDHSTQV